MNVGSYNGQLSASPQQASQGQVPNGSTMNPAMLGAYPNVGGGGGNKFGYGANGVNPTQLMNGMGMDASGMSTGMGMNPGMGGMVNMNNMGGMMGGMQMNGHQSSPATMNPALMQQQGFPAMNGAGMGGVGNMGMSSMDGIGGGMTGISNMAGMSMGGMGGGIGNMGMAAMGGMGGMSGGMGTINPAALGGNAGMPNAGNHSMSNMNSMGGMGNMGNMGMGAGMGINASGMGNMNQGVNPASMNHAMNMNMGGNPPNVGLNPSMNSTGGMPNMGGGNPNMNMQNSLNMNMMQMLQQMGLTRQQFQQLPQHERQMIQAKVLAATQQQQQMQNQRVQQQQMNQMRGDGQQVQMGQSMQNHQFTGMPDRIQQPSPAQDGVSRPRSASSASAAGGQFYDRPSSSASMHNQGQANMAQQQMMPPPPPRPPTAQGHGQQMSRPGTSQSRHSPSISLSVPHNARPPSRAMNDLGQASTSVPMQPLGSMPGQMPSQGHMQPGMPNGVKPPTPLSQHGVPYPNGSQMPFQHGQVQSPPPGSPSRKRKAGIDSPRMGVDCLPGGQMPNQMVGSQGVGGSSSAGMMGPPVLPRQQSGSSEQGIPMTPQLQQMNGMPTTPRPQSSNGMVPHQNVMNARQGAMPQMGPNMSVGQGGMNPALAAAMMGGGLNGMPMGSAMDPGTPQRQSSMPPQTPGFPGTATPRQPSLPPPGTPQKGLQDATVGGASVGSITPMANSRASLPPSLSNAAPSVASTSQPAVIPQLPPLPANVKLNPAVTRVSVVPLVDSTKLIPTLTESEIRDIQGWMTVDNEYEGLRRKMKDKMDEELRETFGPSSLAWWEKGSLSANVSRFRRGREGFDVRYPRSRREREFRDRKKPSRREGLRVPRRLKPEDADRAEELVPIRLEFDVEQHHKMRDTFVWNLNDPVVTPESFAQSIVDDYSLGPSYHSIIVKSIQEQLSDYKAHSTNYDGDERQIAPEEAPLLRGTLSGEDMAWWESWRKRLRTEYSAASRRKAAGKSRKRRKVVSPEALAPSDAGNEEDVKPPEPVVNDVNTVDEVSIHEDMRILIRLDIIVGSIKLDDQFEWDLDNPDASPEEFAEVYAKELGLAGEFKTAIAHSIREQVQTYQKSLFLIGHPSDGSLVQDDDLRMSFLPSLTSGARPSSEVQAYTPQLNYLSDGEIEKNEKERDKDMNKRRKRATRGRRGIALPDREPIRTYRTPAIGFPELDPATLAAAIAASAPTSRRAAAAAASLTIANMVASENGTAFIPQAVPAAPQPVPTATKEKKPKGFFKPPSLPDAVLRARASVTAPTPSTAADVTKLPAPLENDPPIDPIEPPVSTAAAPPDSRMTKVMTAKRAKELEREAKEKEFADGQHPNFIDGVWHCSNCGCPESIAVGRRKGPLGDKSQCGTCGKFWHRHRRPRPVEYNTTLEFHMGIKKEVEGSKTGAKKKGPAALRGQSSTLPNTPTELPSEPQTPLRSDKADIEASSQLSPPNASEEQDRAVSPVSTASSGSEPPLAQRVKINGTNANSTPSEPASARPTSPAPPTKLASSVVVPVVEVPPPLSPPKTPWPPQWLTAAMQAMQAKYTNDKFEVILRKVTASTTPEWRIKCLDCPGKLYTPGPGETLSNYEVHLKNRQHRQRVNDRVNGSSAS